MRLDNARAEPKPNIPAARRLRQVRIVRSLRRRPIACHREFIPKMRLCGTRSHAAPRTSHSARILRRHGLRRQSQRRPAKAVRSPTRRVIASTSPRRLGASASNPRRLAARFSSEGLTRHPASKARRGSRCACTFRPIVRSERTTSTLNSERQTPSHLWQKLPLG
jgi:hypothetical protein